MIGKSIIRKDAKQRALGQTRFTADINYENMFFGVTVRSHVHKGIIKNITYSQDFKHWDKVTIVTANDIPGENMVASLVLDQPVIADKKVSFYGEPIVLIAAQTMELALEAKKNIIIDIEEQEPILTLNEVVNLYKQGINEDNRKKPEKLSGLKTLTHHHIEKGDIDIVFKNADLVVEGEYTTPHQEHAYIEPNAIMAVVEDNGDIRIEGSLQCPYYVLPSVMKVLNKDSNQIHVKQLPIGGAFGGKEDFPSVMASHAALLAFKSNKSVKILYDRHEDIIATTKRHPGFVYHKTALSNEGKILAMKIEFILDGGAYTTLSPVVLARGIIHAAGPYNVKNVRADSYCFMTNTPPNGAFRGFGAPQAFFGLESHIDKCALSVSMNPYDFRKLNTLKEGDTTSTGQLLRESVGSLEVLETAHLQSDFKNKYNLHGKLGKKDKKGQFIGIGMSFFMHGAGFTGRGEALIKAKTKVEFNKNGEAVILVSSTDMGQGAHTVLAQIFAESFPMNMNRISCPEPDTKFVPDSGPTVASRTAMIVGKTVEGCAKEAKIKIIDWLRKSKNIISKQVDIKEDSVYIDSKNFMPLKTAVSEYILDNGSFFVTNEFKLPPEIEWDEVNFKGDAYPTYAWGANVAQVAVDPFTFEIDVLKYLAVFDIGRAINPQIAEGQLEGGVLQSIGFALMEESGIEKGRGFVRDRFQTYIIPTCADIKNINVKIVECSYSNGPGGSKGLGELPMNGGAPAIANAVFHAIGVRIEDLPITPEKILSKIMK